MTVKSIVTNEHRLNPLFHQAIQTIKVNNLKGVSDPKKIISKQVGGIFYLRHQIGLSKMQNFIAKIERLQADNYTSKRFRTQDINGLKFEYKYVYLWHSIAIFNKNKERADEIITKCREMHILASNWL